MKNLSEEFQGMRGFFFMLHNLKIILVIFLVENRQHIVCREFDVCRYSALPYIFSLIISSINMSAKEQSFFYLVLQWP
jgi:hypothetical protein